MKVFQILNGLCHWDATSVCKNLKETKDRFAPTLIFAEAPDYVFEGWGFDSSKNGDARFVKPTPPEGWLYDDATGTFYREQPENIEKAPSVADQLTDIQEMSVDHEYRLTLLELGVTEDETV